MKRISPAGSLPPFSLIRDFRKQNARGNVSKISVNHTCYLQIGSKSTNHSPLAWREEGLKVTLLAVIGGFRSDVDNTQDLRKFCQTFPRVFCFPKSRINENGGKFSILVKVVFCSNVFHLRHEPRASITVSSCGFNTWHFCVIWLWTISVIDCCLTSFLESLISARGLGRPRSFNVAHSRLQRAFSSS